MDHEQKASRFEHATLREIYEQPEAIAETLRAFALIGGDPGPAWAGVDDLLKSRDRLVIAASGSSRHAGLLGEILLEELSSVAVDVEYASEYVYRRRERLLDPAVLVISQSGETGDTLGALREAKSRGETTIAITNVPGSSMAVEADASLITRAGRETAIAATKSFVTQLVMLYLLGLVLGRQRNRIAAEQAAHQFEEMLKLPGLMAEQLPRWEREAESIAGSFHAAAAFLFLGRGLHYPIAREGALKLKEMSYIHAEAYPTGELRHGPNALVGQDSPLIVIATRDPGDAMSMVRYEKTLQLLRDIAGQESHVFAIASEGDTEVAGLARNCLYIPAAPEYVLPFLEVVPLQLFAYFMSLQRGVDVDRPRNLVKSVAAT